MPAKRGCSRSKTRACASWSMSVIRFPSPHRPRRITGDGRVWRENRPTMNNRLTDDEAIERVAVKRGEPRRVKCGLLVGSKNDGGITMLANHHTVAGGDLVEELR